MHAPDTLAAPPVVARLEDFDTASGSWPERLLFNHRPWVMLLCLLATLFLGSQATRLTLNASFEKTIPTLHPYIVNYLTHKGDLGGQGNAVRIVVESRKASISGVQRRLKIGYNRAARMIETMEASGIVGPLQSNGAREVLAPAPPEE